jgi:hypothetical protein
MAKVVLFIFYGVLMLCQITLSAQVVNLGGTGNSVLRSSSYIDVQGSPYLYDDWKPGSITTREGKITENLLLLYDCYKDQLQTMQNGNVLLLDAASNPEFSFLGFDTKEGTMVPVQFKNGYTAENFTKLNYFQVLYEGETSLLKKPTVKFVEEVTNNYGTNDKIKRFAKAEVYFVSDKEKSKLVELGRGRKELYAFFGSKSNEMKSYIKSKKLSIKKDEDLIEVLKHFDSLN